MKKIYLILLILPFCFSANAQKFIKIEDKTFNWGGKVGRLSVKERGQIVVDLAKVLG